MFLLHRYMFLLLQCRPLLQLRSTFHALLFTSQVHLVHQDLARVQAPRVALVRFTALAPLALAQALLVRALLVLALLVPALLAQSTAQVAMADGVRCGTVVAAATVAALLLVPRQVLVLALVPSQVLVLAQAQKVRAQVLPAQVTRLSTFARVRHTIW
jgi:hypothetical protein